jgi:hypothetical protein
MKKIANTNFITTLNPFYSGFNKNCQKKHCTTLLEYLKYGEFMNKTLTKFYAVIFISLIAYIHSSDPDLTEHPLGKKRQNIRYHSTDKTTFTRLSITNNNQEKYYIKVTYTKDGIRTEIASDSQINIEETEKLRKHMDDLAIEAITKEKKERLNPVNTPTINSNDDYYDVSDKQEKTDITIESRCASLLYCILPTWVFNWLYAKNN